MEESKDASPVKKVSWGREFCIHWLVYRKKERSSPLIRSIVDQRRTQLLRLSGWMGGRKHRHSQKGIWSGMDSTWERWILTWSGGRLRCIIIGSCAWRLLEGRRSWVRFWWGKDGISKKIMILSQKNTWSQSSQRYWKSQSRKSLKNGGLPNHQKVLEDMVFSYSEGCHPRVC